MKQTAEFKFLSVVAGGLLLGSSSFAAFEPLPVGARSAGMGEAYTALVDDIYSIYYNPAGLLQLQRPELGAYYSQLFMGLTDNSEISRSFFGYGQPIGKDGRHGGLGVSYLALELPSLYKEEAFGLTYAREYKRIWNMGVSLKMLNKKIGSDEFSNNAIDPITGSATGTADPLLASGASESGFGVDFGLQYRLSRAYALGLAARNLNSPNLGLGGGSDRAPAILSVSLARHLRRGALGVEVMNWKAAESNLRFSIGGEHWFRNGFGLRAGGGFGSRNFSTVNIGASYKMQSIQFDYATVYPLQGIEDTIGMQQISLTVRLGKAPMDPLEQQLIKEKEQRIRAETEARYAKAERDRLKRRLVELTQTQSETERRLEEAAAASTLQDAQDQAQADARREKTDERRAEAQRLFNEYTQALASYNEQVRRGIGLKQKRTILEKIKGQFGDKDVDLSTVERELKSIRVAQNRAKKDFDLSMSFYRRLAQQGASKEERSSMLDRIIQKYKSSGIDIRVATDEMNTLK